MKSRTLIVILEITLIATVSCCFSQLVDCRVYECYTDFENLVNLQARKSVAKEQGDLVEIVNRCEEALRSKDELASVRQRAKISLAIHLMPPYEHQFSHIPKEILDVTRALRLCEEVLSETPSQEIRQDLFDFMRIMQVKGYSQLGKIQKANNLLATLAKNAKRKPDWFWRNWCRSKEEVLKREGFSGKDAAEYFFDLSQTVSEENPAFAASVIAYAGRIGAIEGDKVVIGEAIRKLKEDYPEHPRIERLERDLKKISRVRQD